MTITGTKQKTMEKVVKQESGEEQSGVMKYGTWITGFIAVIMVTIVTGTIVTRARSMKKDTPECM